MNCVFYVIIFDIGLRSAVAFSSLSLLRMSCYHRNDSVLESVR